MLKTLLTTFLVLISPALFAQLLNEDFKYTTASSLTANGWTAHSGSGTNAVKVADGLTYAGLTNTGGSAALTTSGEDINRSFPAVKDGAVYAAFLLNVSAVQDAGDYFFHLGPTTLGSVFRGKVFARKSGTGFQVGVTKASNTPVYAATIYDLNKTYLCVVKYTLKSGTATDDEVVLYVNPVVTEKEPTTTPTSTTPMAEGDTEGDIGTVVMRQGTAANAPTVRVDGIVIATKWEELFVKNDSPSVIVSKFPKQISGEQSIDSVLFSAGNLTGKLFEIAGEGLEFSTKKDFSSVNIGTIAFPISQNNIIENGKIYLRIAKAQKNSVTSNIGFSLDKTAISSNPKVTIDVLISPPANEIQTIGKAKTLPEQTSMKIAGRVTSTGEINGLIYIQDATGGVPISGVSTAINIGDSVQVFGKLSTISKQLFIQSSEFTKIGTTNKISSPKTITLAQLSANEGNFVSVKDVSFSDKKFVFLPNTNYALTEGTATTTVRIWEGTDIDGRTKPQANFTISGVVGRFNDGFQIYPRSQADIPGNGKAGSVSTLPVDRTFDVAEWNIEWFGSTGNGPTDEALQAANVKQVLDSLKADLYVLEEVSNQTAFKNLVAKMTGYEGVCSSAISGGGVADDAQRVCFVYRTDVVTSISTRPLLRGATNLPNYPSDPARFWASGRLPFLMVADVTIAGVKQRLHIVGVHARANTGGTTGTEAERELQYRQRKYDVEVLKDSLDAQFPKESIIVAGDFNDDLDETVSTIVSTKESSYKKYVDDTERWQPITKVLSDEGYRSYISFENMIDHIISSNELKANYVPSSAGVGLPFAFIKNYSNTTSDHIPVTARFQFFAPPTATEPKIGLEAKVFPNPTLGEIELSLDENLSKQALQITLSNPQGHLIFEGNGTWEATKTLLNQDLSKRSAGIYFLKIADKQQQTKVFKIVKE